MEKWIQIQWLERTKIDNIMRKKKLEDLHRHLNLEKCKSRKNGPCCNSYFDGATDLIVVTSNHVIQ